MITIIILIILAAVSISFINADGIISISMSSAEDTIKSQIKEELEIDITDIIVDGALEAKTITKEEIAEELSKKMIILETTDTEIKGEYRGYEVTIDEKNNVIIGAMLTGARPTGEIIILTQGEAEKVEIQVIGSIEEGEITSIESMDGLVPKKENSKLDKIYEIIKNGEYKFKITAESGRTVVIKKKIDNVLEIGESLILAIEEIKESKEVTVKVQGKTKGSSTLERVNYDLDVIRHEGDLVLNGTDTVCGIVPTGNKEYEFGKSSDVGTASTNAKNTVVLKVEGNLTIEEGVKLTAVKSSSGYGGPKGLIVYCTGKITNKGEISMTARGAKAAGQNVYLWKNSNDTWEYVPAAGANGGASLTVKYSSYSSQFGGDKTLSFAGKAGNAGTSRGTGGGGSGSVRHRCGYNYSGSSSWVTISGNGAAGSSYSGGAGGGGATWKNSKGDVVGGSGVNNGGAGGAGARERFSRSRKSIKWNRRLISSIL